MPDPDRAQASRSQSQSSATPISARWFRESNGESATKGSASARSSKQLINLGRRIPPYQPRSAKSLQQRITQPGVESKALACVDDQENSRRVARRRGEV